jgi:integrase
MGLRLERDRKSGEYRIIGSVNGGRVNRSAKTDIKKLAEEKRVALEWSLAKTGQASMRRVGFREAARAYEHGSARSFSRVHHYMLGAAAKYFGDRPVHEIGPREIGEYLNTQYPKCADGTRRRHGATVTAVLRYAHESGWREPIRVSLPPESEGRVRYLTEEEEVRFLAHCPELYWPVFAFLLNTGARVGEAIALDWEDLDLGACTVRLRSKKGRVRRVKTRDVPLNEVALLALAEMRRIFRGKTTGPVFRNSMGYRWAGVRSFELKLATVCREAGITDLVVHDLRHTFASRLVQKGVALQVVSELLGHASVTQTMRYAHLAPGEGRKAVDLLGREVLAAVAV